MFLAKFTLMISCSLFFLLSPVLANPSSTEILTYEALLEEVKQELNRQGYKVKKIVLSDQQSFRAVSDQQPLRKSTTMGIFTLTLEINDIEIKKTTIINLSGDAVNDEIIKRELVKKFQTRLYSNVYFPFSSSHPLAIFNEIDIAVKERFESVKGLRDAVRGKEGAGNAYQGEYLDDLKRVQTAMIDRILSAMGKVEVYDRDGKMTVVDFQAELPERIHSTTIGKYQTKVADAISTLKEGLISLGAKHHVYARSAQVDQEVLKSQQNVLIKIQTQISQLEVFQDRLNEVVKLETMRSAPDYVEQEAALLKKHTQILSSLHKTVIPELLKHLEVSQAKGPGHFQEEVIRLSKQLHFLHNAGITVPRSFLAIEFGAEVILLQEKIHTTANVRADGATYLEWGAVLKEAQYVTRDLAKGVAELKIELDGLQKDTRLKGLRRQTTISAIEADLKILEGQLLEANRLQEVVRSRMRR